MEELKKLVLGFKIGIEDFDHPIKEEVKSRIKTFIDNYNNQVNLIKLNKEDIDMNEYRSLYFKVKMLRKLSIEEKIDVPDIVTL